MEETTIATANVKIATGVRYCGTSELGASSPVSLSYLANSTSELKGLVS
jgi:hypothetical protein